MMPAPVPPPVAAPPVATPPPMQGPNGGRLQIQEPPGGWTRWRATHPVVVQLKEMMRSGNFKNMSARDIQLQYSQFHIFNPVNFEKNFSCIKLELGLRDAVRVESSSAFTAQAAAEMAAQAMPTEHIYRPVSSAPPSEVSGPVVHKMTLPYVMDQWFDGETDILSFQIHHLTGPRTIWYVAPSQKELCCDYWMSKNARVAATALKGFKKYGENHVRTIARKKTIRDMENPDDGLVHWRIKVETEFSIQEEEEQKLVKYAKNGEVWLFLHLVRAGGRRTRVRQSAPSNPSSRSVAGVPSNISIVSGTVGGTRADAVDDLTERMSVWSSPTRVTRASSRVSNSRMEVDSRYTYETVNSGTGGRTRSSRVSRSSRRSREPNPFGNAAASEAAAGAAAASAAAAAAAAVPPTDNSAPLARANKRARIDENPEHEIVFEQAEPAADPAVLPAVEEVKEEEEEDL